MAGDDQGSNPDPLHWENKVLATGPPGKVPCGFMGEGARDPGGGGAGAGAPSGTVPVLFCFSVFARPAAVPHGAGYELLIQKFLSLYGDQIDMHRKFVVQLFAEEWGQYVDLPKGFAVSERCKVRLVPLQIQVGPAGGPHAPPLRVPVRPRPRRALSKTVASLGCRLLLILHP